MSPPASSSHAVQSWLRYFWSAIQTGSGWIFERQLRSLKAISFSISLIILLFMSGVFHWYYFFHGGDLTFQANDWPKEFKYYEILRQSIREGIIPFYVDPPPQHSSLFLAIPEVPLSPQIFLLSFLPVETYFFVNFFIFYCIGFYGCIILKRDFHLSIFSFGIFFLLFQFNGHLKAHMAAGHLMWVSYYLFPWLVWLVVRLARKNVSPTWWIQCGVLLALILLQGSLHLLAIWVLFLIMFSFQDKSFIKPVWSGLLLMLALSIYRFVPALYIVGESTRPFASGYPDFTVLLEGLGVIGNPYRPHMGGVFGELPWWEFDHYIGLSGLLFIGYFGLYMRWKNGEKSDMRLVKYFDIPLMLMVAFSVNYFYYPVSLTGIPLLSTERVVSRFLIIPLVYLFLFGAINFQDFLDKFAQNWKVRILLVLLTSDLVFSLVNHSVQWRMSRIELNAPPSGWTPFFQIVTWNNLLYEQVVMISAGISLMVWIGSLTVLVWMYRHRLRESR